MLTSALHQNVQLRVKYLVVKISLILIMNNQTLIVVHLCLQIIIVSFHFRPFDLKPFDLGHKFKQV